MRSWSRWGPAEVVQRQLGRPRLAVAISCSSPSLTRLYPGQSSRSSMTPTLLGGPRLSLRGIDLPSEIDEQHDADDVQGLVLQSKNPR